LYFKSFWVSVIGCLALVVIGQCTASKSPASARQLGVASIIFSVLAIVITVVLLLIMFLGYGVAIVPYFEQMMKVCIKMRCSKIYRMSQTSYYHVSIFQARNLGGLTPKFVHFCPQKSNRHHYSNYHLTICTVRKAAGLCRCFVIIYMSVF